MASLWEHETLVTDLGIKVPDWIDQDISPCDVAAICQGGCASGAYMPAVTYHQATETMAKHGDAVLDFLNQYTNDLGSLISNVESWSGMAVAFLSAAVELWASSVETEISDVLDLKEEE